MIVLQVGSIKSEEEISEVSSMSNQKLFISGVVALGSCGPAFFFFLLPFLCIFNIYNIIISGTISNPQK